MASDHASHPHCCDDGTSPKLPWYRSTILWMSVLTALLLLASYFLDSLIPFRRAYFEYLGMIWWAILLGFFLGGIMDYFIPHEYISKHLTGTRRRAVFYSVGLGFLMSVCSHGILALSMELHKKGASGPSVVSFLLASPWANLPVTLLLISFFGWNAFLIIISALVIAIVTGFIFQLLDAKGMIEKNPHSLNVDADFSIRRDLARRIRGYRFSVSGLKDAAIGIAKGGYSLFQMVMFWILLGMLLACLTSAFVPTNVFDQYLGPTLLGLLLTMVAATVLEVCSEGTAPLAFELYKQTGAFGNTFAFLMGGVVTDYTEIGLLWQRLGKKTALWMLAITLPQVVLIAFVYNLLIK